MMIDVIGAFIKYLCAFASKNSCKKQQQSQQHTHFHISHFAPYGFYM